MCLCGISSLFRLLSPSVRQVAHALLTRPPLARESLGFIPHSFDLHVLGTPPAFILSQDRTLILNVKRSLSLSSSYFSELKLGFCSVRYSLLRINSLDYLPDLRSGIKHCASPSGDFHAHALFKSFASEFLKVLPRSSSGLKPSDDLAFARHRL